MFVFRFVDDRFLGKNGVVGPAEESRKEKEGDRKCGRREMKLELSHDDLIDAFRFFSNIEKTERKLLK